MNAYSTKTSPEEAVKDIRSQLDKPDYKALLFFASSSFAPDKLSLEMQKAFPGIPVFGCTSAGEIINEKMLKNSVVAMGFGDNLLEDIKVGVIENVHKKDAVEQAFSYFEKYYKQSMLEMDPSQYIGIILIDGLSVAEEKIMDRIGDLTNVTFIGGSAGDDLKFKSTYVSAHGKSYTKAAVLALMKPGTGFDIIKTQSFCQIDKQLAATKVNEAKREVLEFNNKAASDAYAQAIEKPVENINEYFMHNPLGLMVGDEPYVRSPQQIIGNTMVFYCNVKQGMKLSILQSEDIVSDTQKVLEKKKKEIGNFSALINFNCILRTLELENKGQTEAYGKLFAGIPTIGFSTYGEQYIGHINQTATMLVFKDKS
ncbi:FIST domain-containing protein [Desulfonema limicola]|uniref:FIST domain-containing protein n=1 Tax=Desulfonema limicola TaxID=45656 RepID=A0A975GHG1_9BACT|nr:FIST N-terminal domain-containing protein [Desulfonema limicola]QTA81401.1 FIST domain-containing protein [Desulfonema limicola]